MPSMLVILPSSPLIAEPIYNNIVICCYLEMKNQIFMVWAIFIDPDQIVVILELFMTHQ